MSVRKKSSGVRHRGKGIYMVHLGRGQWDSGQGDMGQWPEVNGPGQKVRTGFRGRGKETGA